MKIDSKNIKNIIIIVLVLYTVISLFIIFRKTNDVKTSNELIQYLQNNESKYKDSISLYKNNLSHKDSIIKYKENRIDDLLIEQENKKPEINNIKIKNDEKINNIKHMSVDESMDFFSKWAK